MINSIFDTSTIPLLQRAASFAERRHEVLAGNVANLSTPDYKMRDLPVASFQAAMREAVAQRQNRDVPAEGNWLYASDRAQAPEKLFTADLFHSIEAAPGALTFQDGNNRSIENQALEMTKNSLLQQVAIELMTIQMNRLQAVISERP
jgi:flagellar basal-body rod protein FlgB